MHRAAQLVRVKVIVCGVLISLTGGSGDVWAVQNQQAAESVASQLAYEMRHRLTEGGIDSAPAQTFSEQDASLAPIASVTDYLAAIVAGRYGSASPRFTQFRTTELAIETSAGGLTVGPLDNSDVLSASYEIIPHPGEKLAVGRITATTSGLRGPGEVSVRPIGSLAGCVVGESADLAITDLEYESDSIVRLAADIEISCTHPYLQANVVVRYQSAEPFVHLEPASGGSWMPFPLWTIDSIAGQADPLPQEVSVRNSGTAAVALGAASVTVEVDSGELIVESGSCDGAVLGPGDECELNLAIITESGGWAVGAISFQSPNLPLGTSNWLPVESLAMGPAVVDWSVEAFDGVSATTSVHEQLSGKLNWWRSTSDDSDWVLVCCKYESGRLLIEVFSAR